MRPDRPYKTATLMAVVFSLVFAGIAAGKTAPAKSASGIIPPAKKCHCFRGRPAPGCDLFWLTEIGLVTVVGSHDGHPGAIGGKKVLVDFGYMGNLGRSDAVGASLGVIVDTRYDDAYPALKPRYRRWLSRDFGLDVALGVGINQDSPSGTTYPLLAQIDLTFRDLFSMSLLAERYRWVDSRWDSSTLSMIDEGPYTATTLSFGLTARSYPALVVAGTVLVATVIMIEDTVVR